MKKIAITTVTGEKIHIGRYTAYGLNYVIECGNDWIADISVADAKNESNNHAHRRVFVSQNPGVELLMNLAHQGRYLKIVKY